MFKTDSKSSPDSRADEDRAKVELLVARGLFADDAIRGLIDDWLVPRLVDKFLRNPRGKHYLCDDADNRGSL